MAVPLVPFPQFNTQSFRQASALEDGEDNHNTRVVVWQPQLQLDATEPNIQVLATTQQQVNHGGVRRVLRNEIRPPRRYPTGRYRGICKLWIQKQDSWWHGTGWIVEAQNYVVTAAHCVYTRDPVGSEHYATQVWASVGYDGMQNDAARTSREFRQARFVAIHQEYRHTGSVLHDLAIMKLEYGFDQCSIYQWINTPANSNTQYLNGSDVRVVGYPAGYPAVGFYDGEHMFESSGTQQWINLNTHAAQFPHQLETWGGTSGAPMFQRVPHATNHNSALNVIAIHTWGTPGQGVAATCLMPAGNTLTGFIAALKAISTGPQVFASRPIVGGENIRLCEVEVEQRLIGQVHWT